jgi:hypothetical protein
MIMIVAIIIILTATLAGNRREAKLK